MTKLLWHKDMVRLLELKEPRCRRYLKSSAPQHDRYEDVKKILDGVRKHSNSAYKGVVQGSRPSRADKTDQQIAAGMSRQTAAAYWMARIKGDV